MKQAPTTRLRGWLARVACLAILSMSATACTTPQQPPLQPVGNFELKRYLGEWHEVARITAWFQRDCAADTSATYAIASDTPEWVAVTNRCRNAQGGENSAEGRARFTGPPDQGALEVTFAKPLGIWLWPAAGAYVVIALDPDYRWSVVAHPSRDFAWILSRDRTMAPAMMRQLAGRLREVGYDLCRVDITAGENKGKRLCDL